jgi:hypothetical protein
LGQPKTSLDFSEIATPDTGLVIFQSKGESMVLSLEMQMEGLHTMGHLGLSMSLYCDQSHRLKRAQRPQYPEKEGIFWGWGWLFPKCFVGC